MNLTTKSHAPSAQQEDVINFITGDIRSLNLKARAGCGKTSTILMILPYVGSKKVFIGAYNKAIAKEIEAKIAALGFKFPQYVASTMHAAGFSGWRKSNPAVKVEGRKLDIILDEAEATPNVSPVYKNYHTVIAKLVSLAKQRAFGFLYPVDDTAEWFSIVEHFGMDEDVEGEPDWEEIIRAAIVIFKKSLRLCHEVIDFDDMILAPLVFKARMFQYHFVIIDEAQDTNPSRRALAKAMLLPGVGRLIAVGDPAQAIYGFTGADSDSMDIIRREMGSAELPLNVTYRCPKNVVALAQQWVPDIAAAEGNPEGLVTAIRLATEAKDSKERTFRTEALGKEDVVLCRNTKPLVEEAYGLLRRGIGCYVEGREIGAGLIKLARRWKAKKITTLLGSVEEYRDREVQKWLAKGREAKAEQVADQCDTLIMLGNKLVEEGQNEVECLIVFINSLFGDTPEDTRPAVVTLCTIHRSKGREWKRVYLLGRNKYQPSKYARKAWQIEQENNLAYVAVTRAQEELVEVIVP